MNCQPPGDTPTIDLGRASLTAQGVHVVVGTGDLRQRVLIDVSLQILPGQFSMLCGPSGCGKSTLLAVLAGLQRSNSGTVSVLGTDLTNLDADQLEAFRLHHTGFVFQGFNLFPSLTALQQVMLPLQYLRWPARRVLASATAALQEVGLDRQMSLRPAQLSGGEKQRVAVARALAKNPQLLFADEPTSALDSENGETVVRLLRRIAADHGTTVLCASHDLRIARYADRLVRMEDGRIIEVIDQPLRPDEPQGT